MARAADFVRYIVCVLLLQNLYAFRRRSLIHQSSKICCNLKAPHHSDVPISNVGQLQKDIRRHVVGAASIVGFISASRITRPSIVKAFDMPECSDSLTIFKSLDGSREIIMIGTAHISEDSANLVRRTIQTVKPDVVMIELDAKRIGRVGGGKSLEELGFDVPPETSVDGTPLVSTGEDSLLDKQTANKFITGFAVAVASMAQQAAGALLGKALSQFYNSIEKLGFVAGGEFKAAVTEGRAIGARILLGDRNVDVTLQHLATALSNTDSASFDRVVEKLGAIEDEAGLTIASPLPGGTEFQITKDTVSSFVERVKQRDLLTSLMGTVKKEIPLVYNALIGERDAFMAQSLSTSSGKNIVGVVGMAHMDGIERNLVTKYGFKVVTRNCPAPADMTATDKAKARKPVLINQ